MPKPEQISGAGIPMSIGGTMFKARTLSDRDYDELNAWVRWRFLEDQKEAIDKMALIREDRQEMLTSAMLASSQVTFNSPEGSRIANSNIYSFARVGWQMIHHYHPQVSLEEFEAKVVGDESDAHKIKSMHEINRVFIYLNIGTQEDDEDIKEAEGTEDSEVKSKSNES